MTSPTPSVPLLRIGTRGSRLARAQANDVRESLVRHGALIGEPIVISTSGDRIRDRPLAEFGGKGLFAKELEEELIAGSIDIAVHSMKDLPVVLPPGLMVAATPPRENPFDAFIARDGATFASLAPLASVGTCSVRRMAQIARRRSDLRIVSMRGNIDTRLAKLQSHDVDAIILAAAGLHRIGMKLDVASLIADEDWLPALGQGALAIEMRESDARADWVRSVLDHQPTAVTTACERAFQNALGGSCRSPMAGLASVVSEKLTFRGEVLAPDGSASVVAALEIALGTDPVEAAARAGREAGLSLRPAALQWLSD